MSSHCLAGYQTGFPAWVPVLRAGKGVVCSRRGSDRIASLNLPFAILPPFKNWVLAVPHRVRRLVTQYPITALGRDCPKMKTADLTGENRRENLRAIAASSFLTRGNFLMASNTMPFIPSLGIYNSRNFAQKPHQSIVSGVFLPFSHFLTLATSSKSLKNCFSQCSPAIFTPFHSVSLFTKLFYRFLSMKDLQLSFFDFDARSNYFFFNVAKFSRRFFSQEFFIPKNCRLQLIEFIHLYIIRNYLFDLQTFRDIEKIRKNYLYNRNLIKFISKHEINCTNHA